MASRSKKKRKKAPVQEIRPVKTSTFPLWDKHPDWICIGILLVLLLAFYWPVMIGGKTFLPPDSIAARASQPYVEEALSQKVYPLWNPYIFSGMPLFASLSRAPYTDPINDVFMGLVRVVSLWQMNPHRHFIINFLNIFLTGGLVYLLLRSKKMSPLVALAGAIAMVLMPGFVANAAFGHSTKIKTISLIPLIFLLVERLVEKRNLLFFSLTGLVIGLQLLRAHMQISYYTHLMVAAFLVFWIVTGLKDGKSVGRLASGVGLYIGALAAGVVLSSILNLSVWEYSAWSIRGGGSAGLDYGYATGWSFSPAEMLTFIIPSFMGFGGETYWGPMGFTDYPQYMGLVTLMLAGLALVIRRNRTVWLFTIVAGLALVISFGKHLPVLYGPMFKLAPFFNKFRVPSMILILMQFSTVVLAAFGLTGLMSESSDPRANRVRDVKRYLAGFGAVVAVLFLVLLVAKSAYLGWAVRSRLGPEAAYDKALADGFKALLIFGASTGLVLLSLKRNGRFGWIPFALVGLLVVDLWMTDSRFMHPQRKTDETAFFAETPDVTFLKNQDGLFRILPVGDQRPPNWYMAHKIQSVWGYHAAKIKRYQELADAFNMPNGFFQKYLKVEGGQYTWRNPAEINAIDLALHRTYLKLLNVRYILCPYALPDTTFEMVQAPYGRGANGVYRYRDALPRAYFVDDVRVEQGSEAVYYALTRPDFDPARTAVIEKTPPFDIVKSDENTVRVTTFNIHTLDLVADVKTPSFLVVSEVDYPAGWKTYVDGEERAYTRTNGVLRGLFLEPGSHQVTFRFEPRMFKAGLGLSLGTAAFLITGIIAGLWLERKKRQKTVEEHI